MILRKNVSADENGYMGINGCLYDNVLTKK